MKERSVVPNRVWRGTITANEGGGMGKGGTIGMLKSVMRGSGKFFLQHNQNLPTSSPPRSVSSPNPWDENIQCTCPGWISVKTKYNTSLIYSVRTYFLNVTIVYFQTFPFITCFFFIIPFCICISLIFCYKLHVYTSLFLPKLFLFFSFLHFSSLPRHFLLFPFFTYIIFSCSFNTFLIFLHNFCLSEKLLIIFFFHDFYSGFFFNWLFYVTENIYFFIYVNVYFILFMAFLIKTSSFLFFLLQKKLKNSFGSNIYAKNFF